MGNRPCVIVKKFSFLNIANICLVRMQKSHRFETSCPQNFTISFYFVVSIFTLIIRMRYTLLVDSKNGTVKITFPYKYRSHDRLMLQTVTAVGFKMQKEHISLLFSLLRLVTSWRDHPNIII